MSRLLILVVPSAHQALLCLIVLVAFLGACAPKTLTPATQVIYEGELEGDYVSSERVVEEALAVKDCMGLSERSFPFPQIRALSGGDGVECGDFIARGCYFPGTIVVPDDVEIDIIAHELVHHYLLLETGDMDSEHKSEWFLKCGGAVKAY